MLSYFLIAVILVLCLLEMFIIFRQRKQISKRDLALVVSQWRVILEQAEREPKHALVEADKLLDFVLKRRGYSGAMGDKLKKAGKIFSNADNVWSAHKLRNRVVHEVGFNASRDQAVQALGYFKKALWDLGVKI